MPYGRPYGRKRFKISTQRWEPRSADAPVQYHLILTRSSLRRRDGLDRYSYGGRSRWSGRQRTPYPGYKGRANFKSASRYLPQRFYHTRGPEYGRFGYARQYGDRYWPTEFGGYAGAGRRLDGAPRPGYGGRALAYARRPIFAGGKGISASRVRPIAGSASGGGFFSNLASSALNAAGEYALGLAGPAAAFVGQRAIDNIRQAVNVRAF